MKRSIPITLLAILAAVACGETRKLEHIRASEVAATLALSREEKLEEERTIRVAHRDTLTVMDDDGKELLIMKAVKDENTGEMVATDVLDAAVVTARFRNIAERHGRIDLRFEIIVPREMQDSKWQLRFYPDMFILGDSLRLDPVMITGKDYRKAQLRGYQQYEKFLRSIVTDTTLFIDLRNLEIFLQRNIPQIYQFRNDTSYVSDEQFISHYGVTEKAALDHYTNHFAKRRNERKKARRGQMWSKYVKSPIVTEGIRLDTVIQNMDGDFVYHYVQSVMTRPKLRKVDIVLSGDIWQADERLYAMKRSDPLSFYISSFSSFADGTERYLTRIVERKVSANTACYVDFESGKADVNIRLGHNREEIGRIEENIRELLNNETYDIDSVVISASASPEGRLDINTRLSERRAKAISDYFDRFIRHWKDSVRREGGFALSFDGENDSKGSRPSFQDIDFISRSLGENWDMLTFLVENDSTLTKNQVRSFRDILSLPDVDTREARLQKEPYYRYLRENLYPRLRTVRFDFRLNRKGMVKDTIHTTVIDSLYMRGVQALRDRDYEQAITLLRPYRDFNTAIAYLSMDYNASAMDILKDMERTPEVNYMLAILHARNGDDENAVQCYLSACRKEPSYVHRGNLDPEIYVLIQRYGLNRQDDNSPDLY